MRIGHASISENKNNGRDGKAKAGDQTGKEVCIRNFYKKPWKYLLRCKDPQKAEVMAKACEAICNNPNVGYDQSQRLTLHNVLQKSNYNYNDINTPCECDCSSFMTVCAECAGIFPKYSNGNAPVTSNMVTHFKNTGMFDVLTDGVNEEYNLRRGDILVGAPGTHTVMVLDNGGTGVVQTRRTLKKGMSGSDVMLMQQILQKLGYDLGRWGVDSIMGNASCEALKQFQKDRLLKVDGICGQKTWLMLEQYN